jgi:GGDEF domain-containing protein
MGASASSYTPVVAEHSSIERFPPRVELSPEELTLLLGADRFGREAPTSADEPVGDDHPPRVAPADAVQPPHGAPRQLGDADLVQAVLDGAPHVEDVLLRVVRERSGEPLARLVDGAAAEAMVAAGTGTRVDDSRAFVAPLPADARAAWAEWLARWLRLAALVALRAPKGAWDEPTGLPAWERVRAATAQRIAAARLRREAVHVSVIRLEDGDLWNRRSQVLVNDALLARAAAEMDQAVGPGDVLARLDDGAFALVSGDEGATARIVATLRAMAATLPADGPRSLQVRSGVATAPWDAVCPTTLVGLATRRAAETRP